MCGGTARTTSQPEGCPGASSCVSDAGCGARRIYKKFLRTKIQKRAWVDWGIDHTELDSSCSWSCSELDLGEIRLIVYQDCERRGRQVLFDSKAVQKIEEAAAQKAGDVSGRTSAGSCRGSGGGPSCGASGVSSRHAKEQPPKYQYTRPASDISMLGEMMFGSVAMSYKGSTLKIHYIRSPPQLMVSKVFSARMGSFCGSTNNLQDSFESIHQDAAVGGAGVKQSSLGACRTGASLGLLQGVAEGGPLRLTRSASFFAAHSTPVDMPSRGQNEDRDSGIARSASLSSLLITPFPSPSSSTSSSSSYQRRWLRSQTTSLENGIIPRRSTDETFSLADEPCGSNPAIVRRKKIAISIIFSLCEKEEAQRNFQDFFFSHFPLFESHMNRLKCAIEKAMISCRKIAESSLRVQVYVSRLMDALGEFRGTIWNLYSVPRIVEPVWLAMMSSTLEKSQLCQRFLKEFTLLIEHINKNQFFAALLTAVLTHHLAWVPTVMPVDHPPSRVFSEKRTSHSVNMLAKTHPYNPLWAQLGDLYGAIGSPVRLTRTVVLGKQKDLVQRILYVLTYFLRCSELQDNQLTWSGGPTEGDQVISGSKIVTALERGEVEESEYVVVTVRSEPALVPPILPLRTAESSGPGPAALAGAADGAGGRDLGGRCDRGGRSSAACSRAFPGPAPVGDWPPQGVFCGGGDSEEVAPPAGSPGPARLEGPDSWGEAGPRTVPEELGEELPRRVPQRSAAWPCAGGESREQPPAGRVTFQIGSSASPESDFESRTKNVHERLRGCCGRHPGAAGTSEAGDRRASGPSCGGVSCPKTWVPGRGEAGSGRAIAEGAVGAGAPSPEAPRGLATATGRRTPDKASVAGGPSEALAPAPAPDGRAPQGSSPLRAADVPRGAASGKAPGRAAGDIPRNDSSDSALGDSDGEGCAAVERGPHLGAERPEGSLEVELPLPRSQSISNPSARNFGRSLLAGYCPTYMPDLVLHGTSAGEKLKQCLLADLVHTVHHPVLDEPIAEAVCIIADTDKWSVQVATSQRRVTDSVKLGQDVLVSSQVSSLLQSILQLHKLHLPADFCVMHLEDRLQELYLKSKMLSEYLRGHTRVHVKELGVVLGIESNDLPLLTAIASTHSPYVAQILL